MKCPRLYYLHSVYKDDRTGHKITIMNPHLALGQIVHEVVESLSVLKVEDRLKDSLLDKYDTAWNKVTGEMGGFNNLDDERMSKERGTNMLKRIMDNPGFILNKAIKLTSSDSLPPRYYLSEEEAIILCGKIDWLEYIPEDNSVHIIDFKTGKNEEDENSLQLPIYYLLVKNLQKRNVKKASYWYLDRNDEPTEVKLPAYDDVYEKVLNVAIRVKQTKIERNYLCPKGGCYACIPYEQILNKKAKFVGCTNYQNVYILNR